MASKVPKKREKLGILLEIGRGKGVGRGGEGGVGLTSCIAAV